MLSLKEDTSIKSQNMVDIFHNPETDITRHDQDIVNAQDLMQNESSKNFHTFSIKELEAGGELSTQSPPGRPVELHDFLFTLSSEIKPLRLIRVENFDFFFFNF